MADTPVQVIVAAFHDLNGASDALKALKEAKREKMIDIEDAAVITKDANGKVKIKETADMGFGKGATIGAVAGGVIGLLAGPVGWAALGGGVIGGLAAKLRDGGFSDARLKQLSEGMTPNSSALVAVIDHRWVAEVEQELARQQADIITQALSDDIREQLTTRGSAVYTVVDNGEAVAVASSSASPDGTESTAPTTSNDAEAMAASSSDDMPHPNAEAMTPPADTHEQTPPTP